MDGTAPVSKLVKSSLVTVWQPANMSVMSVTLAVLWYAKMPILADESYLRTSPVSSFTTRLSTEGALTEGKWHDLVVNYDQHAICVMTDGIKGTESPMSGCMISPYPMALGCSVRGKEFFEGEIAELSMVPK